MKIVLLSDAHSVHTAKIANGLSRRGHTIFLLSLHAADHTSSPQIYDCDVKLHIAPGKGSWFAMFWLIMKANFLAAFGRVDVVWANYASSYGTLLPFIRCRCRLSSVWGSDIMVQAFKRRHRWRVRLGLDAADLVLVTSNILRDYAIAFTRSPIAITPFGPSDQFFKPMDRSKAREHWRQKLELSTQARLVVCNKWMKHVYGIDLLIEAFALLKAQSSMDDWHLALTGSGQDEDLLLDLIEQRGLSDRVHLVGYLEQPQVATLLAGAHVAVYPSRSESFGVSVLEALALGTHVIAARVGGIPEVTGHGRFAQLLDVVTPQTIALAITEHLKKSDFSPPDGARQFCESFNWSSCMDRMEALLKEVVSGQRLPLIETGYEGDERPIVIFSHSVGFQESPTRARALRVDKLRAVLKQRYRLIEISGDIVPDARFRRWLDLLLTENDILFGYGEFPATPHAPKKPHGPALLNEALNRASIPSGIFIPDLHEMDDTYVNSPAIAQFLHEARAWRQAELERLNTTLPNAVFIPSYSFADFMTHSFPFTLDWPLQPLPGGVTYGMDHRRHLEKLDVGLPVAFIYAGGIGPFYRLDRMLEAVASEAVLMERTQLYLRARDVAVLTQPQQARLTALSDCICTDQSISADHVAEDKMCIGLILTENLGYFAVAMPIKLYTYLERQWPILCTKGTAIADLVEQHDLGWTVECSVAAIRDQMIALCKDPLEVCAKRQSIARFNGDNRWEDRVRMIEKALLDEAL